ncbi:MAG: class I SAM-dependent methyltransferase [Gammaproteobacteria bacterium]
MKRISLLEAAHTVVRDRLRPGDIAIDATVGNGNDTLFLLRHVQPTGRVYGFDVQQSALDSALAKIREEPFSDCLTVFHAGHEEMSSLIPSRLRGRVSACMFNLGYLPGGDKSIVTVAESTLAALTAACELLAEAGVITLVAYSGHPGGERETECVQQGCAQLSAMDFETDMLYSDRRNDSAPRLFIIRKNDRRKIMPR